jgi:hypothetical protein
VCWVVFGDAGLEAALEPFEQGGAEHVLQVGVDDLV